MKTTITRPFTRPANMTRLIKLLNNGDNTITEIANIFGVSKQAVSSHRKKLIAKGKLHPSI